MFGRNMALDKDPEEGRS